MYSIVLFVLYRRIEQLKEEKDQLLLKLSGHYSKVDEEIKLALQKKREELLQDINIEDLKVFQITASHDLNATINITANT